MTHLPQQPRPRRALLLATHLIALTLLSTPGRAQDTAPTMPTRIVSRTVSPTGSVTDLPLENVRRGQTVIQETHIQATSGALRNASVDISLPPSTRFVGLLELPSNIGVLYSIDHVTFSAVPLEPGSTAGHPVPASPAEYVAVRLKIDLLKPGDAIDARILINIY